MAIDKAVDSGVLDAGLKQIADAIRAKGGTSAQLEFPAAMAEAIAAIESGGGGGGLDWVDDYTNFSAGTFTPAENTTSYTIDTGIPYRGDNHRQELIMWRDPSANYGFIIGCMSSLVSGAANPRSGAVVGYNATYASSLLKLDSSPLPEIGETAWTIGGLTVGINFRAGETYHWMLLEKAK